MQTDHMKITPEEALEALMAGHQRFLNGQTMQHNLLQKIKTTGAEPSPFAIILTCMDSRTPAELIFDQGIGDIFNIRIAGNVVSPHVLACLEFAITVAEVKLVVVMGHTDCAAIKSVCNHLYLENFYSIRDEIKPCICREATELSNRTGDNKSFVNKVALLNVHHSIQQMQERSSTIRQHAAGNRIKIVPAMYDVHTGGVTTFTT